LNEVSLDAEKQINAIEIKQLLNTTDSGVFLQQNIGGLHYHIKSIHIRETARCTAQSLERESKYQWSAV
jgi:Cu/Zn superoxide dismutase